jgi:hypothetical protein
MTAMSISFDVCASIPKSSLRNAGRLAMVKRRRTRLTGGSTDI